VKIITKAEKIQKVDTEKFMCSKHEIDYRLLCDECKEKHAKFADELERQKREWRKKANNLERVEYERGCEDTKKEIIEEAVWKVLESLLTG